MIEDEGGTRVRCHGLNIDVAHLEALDVADEEAVSWDGSEHIGLGIGILALGGRNRGVGGRASAAMLDVDVAQLDLFDGMIGNSADDRPESRYRIRANNVADQHASQPPNLRAAGPAHPAAKPQKNRD